VSELGAHPYRDSILRDAAVDIAQAIIDMVARSGEALLQTIETNGYAITTLTLNAPKKGAQIERQIFKQAGLPESIDFDIVFEEEAPGAVAAFMPYRVKHQGRIAQPGFGPPQSPWARIGPGNTLFFFVLPRGSQQIIARGNGERVWAGILALLEQNTGWIIHEVVHMIDNMRGKGFLQRVLDNPQPREYPVHYFSAPWEFNAFFQEGMFNLRRRIEKMPSHERQWTFSSYRNFETTALKEELRIPGKPRESLRVFRTYLTPKMRKKFDRRLRQTYDFWKEAQ
jgi:hypothetical protein